MNTRLAYLINNKDEFVTAKLWVPKMTNNFKHLCPVFWLNLWIFFVEIDKSCNDMWNTRVVDWIIVKEASNIDQVISNKFQDNGVFLKIRDRRQIFGVAVNVFEANKLLVMFKDRGLTLKCCYVKFEAFKENCSWQCMKIGKEFGRKITILLIQAS